MNYSDIRSRSNRAYCPLNLAVGYAPSTAGYTAIHEVPETSPQRGGAGGALKSAPLYPRVTDGKSCNSSDQDTGLLSYASCDGKSYEVLNDTETKNALSRIENVFLEDNNRTNANSSVLKKIMMTRTTTKISASKTANMLMPSFKGKMSQFLSFTAIVIFCVVGNITELKAQDAVIASHVIAGSPAPTLILGGAGFQYQITLRCDNTGTAPCTDFIVSDVLPLGMEFSEFTLSNTFNVAPGFGSNDPPIIVSLNRGGDPTFTTPASIELDFGTVQPGSSVVLTLNVRFGPLGNYPDGLTLTNTATVSSSNDAVSTNNSVDSPPIEAQLMNEWFVDKRIVSIGALDALTTYDIYLRNLPGASYWGTNGRGSLALYDAIVFDELETGLTCAEVDPAATTGLAAGNHALCLAPGASGAFLSGITVTNPSLTDYSLAWDYASLYNLAEPFTRDNTCTGCDPVTPGGQVQQAGPLEVGVIYPSTVFSDGQTVVNTAQLYGSFAADLGGTTLTPIAFLDDADRSHVVEAGFASASFTKSMTGRTRDSTFVGAGTRVDLDIRNTGNIDLTDITFTDFMPAEVGNVSLIHLRIVSFTGAVATIQYSNGTSEVVPFTSDRLTEGTNFNIPAGAQIVSLEIALGVPIAPGGRALININGEILPTRFVDDNHTAVDNNPSQNPDIDDGTQLVGSAVALGEEVTNCGSYEAMSSAGSISGESCDQLYVVEPFFTVTFGKLVSTNTPQPIGGTLVFTSDVFTPGLATFVESYTISDTLPEGLTYIPGSISPTPAVVTYTPNIDGTNRDLLEYTVEPGGNTSRIEYRVVIDSDHPAGTFENTIFLTDFVPEPGQPSTIRVAGPTGGQILLTTDGYTTPLPGSSPNTLGVRSGWNAADVVYNVLALPSGVSEKYVDADLTPGQSGPGGVEVGSLGSTATFTLFFMNSGNDTLQNLRFVDLLPRIGDMSPLTCTARDTEWEPDFAGGITATFTSDGITVPATPIIEYSTDPDPCVAYYVPGPEPCGPCTAGTFSTTPPATLSDVLAIGMDFGNLKIPPGDSIALTFNVTIPNTAQDGIAWNTFAWSATGLVSGAEIGAEPPLVGLTTDQFDLGLTKIVSAATPGPFASGDMVSFDIRVINQGEIDAFDIDVLDYFNATELNFLNFSSPTMSTLGAPVTITATDVDGADGVTGFEVSELAVGDEVTVTVAFTIDPAFTGMMINNNSEIVAGSVLDGGATTFDFDSDLAMTGGSGTEVDNEIGDETNGGADDPNDQDDFDFAQIMICNEPTITATINLPSCVDGVPQVDGVLQIDATNGTSYHWSLGATFDDNGGANTFTNATSLAGAVFPLQLATDLPNPAGGSQSYTIRIYNGSNGCFTDEVLTLDDILSPPLMFTAVASCDDENGMQVAANMYYVEVSAITGGNGGPYTVTVAGALVPTQTTDGTSSIFFGPFMHSVTGGAVQLVNVTDEGTGVPCETTASVEVPEVLCGINDGGQNPGCFCAGPTTDPAIPTSFILAQSQPGTFMAGGSSGQIQKYVLVNDAGIIVAMNLTGLFEVPVAGTYTPYAINYRADEDPTLMNFLLPGEPIQPILDGVMGNGPLADACFAACNIDATVSYESCSCYSVGSTVFSDLNNDGVFDEGNGENGLPGITIELYAAGATPGVDDPIGTDVTDSNGDYYFGGLDPGMYFLNIPTPSSVYPISSTPTDVADNGEDNDDNGIQTTTGTAVTSPVFELGGLTPEPSGAVESGTGGTQDDAADLFGDMTQDFGFIAPVTVGDTTFVDIDMDGTQSVGDLALAGVTVTIYDVATGLPVALNAEGMPYPNNSELTTGSMGEYLFENLPPGNYYVEFDISSSPNGAYYDFTTPNAGSDDTADSDAVPAAATDDVANSSSTGPLTSGQSDLTLDAGVVCAVSVTVAAPFTICATATIDLTTNASLLPVVLGGNWTTADGSGVFLDSAGDPIAAPYVFGVAVGYAPSAADRNRGYVTLTLTSNTPPLTSGCDAVSEELRIEILQVDCGAFFWDGSND